MNLKANLQKMEVSDLKFVCKELGVSCPKTKSSIIKRLLEPLKISYKMNKRKRVKVKRKMKCSEINELYKNPIDKTRKIKECEKRDDCTWTIHPGHHKYFQCMSKKYINDVRPRLVKIKEKYAVKRKHKLNKFNQLIEKAHKKDVDSGNYSKRAFKRMKTLQQKNKDISLSKLLEKIDINENPQDQGTIYDRYTPIAPTTYNHY